MVGKLRRALRMSKCISICSLNARGCRSVLALAMSEVIAKQSYRTHKRASFYLCSRSYIIGYQAILDLLSVSANNACTVSWGSGLYGDIF